MNLTAPLSTNIVCVLYILKHKIYKDYNTLIAKNDFTQLLKPAEGVTVAFQGNQTDANLPVANQYYQVVKKVKFNLRNSGTYYSSTTPAAGVANNNSAPFNHRMSINLIKHLPKSLLYPESQVTTNGDFPTNSNLFWSIGYYNMDMLTPGGSFSWIVTQYTSRLTYKDL